MTFGRFRSCAMLSVVCVGLAQVCLAQDNSGSESGWSASSQQQDPQGVLNPTRSRETHTEAGGRVISDKAVQTLGPDGRYIPYSDTEKESVRIDATTVRNIERTFGRGPDGQRTLIQERQEESRDFPGGEQKVVRTTLNPDANGALTVVQREFQDVKQLGPGETETKTTVLTPDLNGGLAPSMQIELREQQSKGGTVDFKKSTLVSDGTGRWQLAEVREGNRTEGSDHESRKEEQVLRPDSNGKLAVVERTVSKQSEGGPGEKENTIETYSINVPGTAGDDGLQFVQRETIRGKTNASQARTTRQIERPNPGNTGDGLHVTEETIDIVRAGNSGVADQKRTILTSGSDGRLDEVWIDIGKTDNPGAMPVGTSAPGKAK